MNEDDTWEDESGRAGATRKITLPGSRARLILLSGPEAGRAFSLGGEAVIGRDVSAAVQVDDPDVSRQHARISKSLDGKWFIEDLNSRNGTLVNGLPVQTPQQLNFGDRLQCGANAFLVFTLYDRLEDHLIQSQKMESIGRLAGGIAHDFANLLSVIVSSVEQLQEQSRGQQTLPVELVDDNLRMINQAVDRALDLTKRLLSISRHRPEEQQPTDLAEVIQEVIQLIRHTFPSRIRVETSVAAPLVVLGDRALLHQVLMNLCLNARDAMPSGGRLCVTAVLKELDLLAAASVPLARPGTYVVLSVTDTGSGMTEDTCQRAFEPFFTTKAPDKGTGLGLATVYSVIKNHGGKVNLMSTLGVGTTVNIYLPELGSSSSDSEAP